MLRIVTLLLVGLVCQAEAALFKCVVTSTTEGVADAVADCDAGIESCFTKVVTDGDGKTITTRGCSAASCVAVEPAKDSSAGTACATCLTNRDLGCNAPSASDDFSCYDSVEKKAHVCTDGAKTDKCFKRTSTKDAPEERGCGECVTGADWTCGTDCANNVDYGCNKPELTCFDSKANAKETCAIEVTACQTKTLVADKAVVRGCGKCDTVNADWVCKDDCTEEMADGCNEPARFQCFQSVEDAAEAADCAGVNLYNQTQCYTNTGSNGTAVEKGCGACRTSGLATGVTCVACDGAKCNSAIGLFSMLTVCLAIIYQMA